METETTTEIEETETNNTESTNEVTLSEFSDIDLAKELAHRSGLNLNLTGFTAVITGRQGDEVGFQLYHVGQAGQGLGQWVRAIENTTKPEKKDRLRSKACNAIGNLLDDGQAKEMAKAMDHRTKVTYVFSDKSHSKVHEK